MSSLHCIGDVWHVFSSCEYRLWKLTGSFRGERLTLLLFLRLGLREMKCSPLEIRTVSEGGRSLRFLNVELFVFTARAIVLRHLSKTEKVFEKQDS
jgi:hypothetical protein